MNERYHLILAVTGLLGVACSSDESAAPATNGAEPPNTAATRGDDIDATGDENDAPLEPDATLAGCERGSIEPDFIGAPLAGPAIVAGALPTGEYLFSSTYLQLGRDTESQRLFQMLVDPVVADLQTRAGLLALSLGTSASCGTARTLAVWQDDASMIAFVSGEAHANAMARITDVSRGGSIVTHWVGDESSAEWAQAATRISRSTNLSLMDRA